MQLKKDWKTRLAEAERRGRFTKDDKNKISIYDTCFVGEHYDKSSYLGDGHWLTNEERELGRRAYIAVLRDDIARALEIYEEVQKLYT